MKKKLDIRSLKVHISQQKILKLYKRFLDKHFPLLAEYEKVIIVARFPLQMSVKTICAALKISQQTITTAIVNFQTYDKMVDPVTPQEADWKQDK